MVSTSTYKYILFEQRDRVAIITLNRPDRLNAWTYAMNDEIMAAIEACNNDDGVGAIVITGAGRGFCAGADVQGFNNSIEKREDRRRRARRRMRRRGRRSTWPRSCGAPSP